MENPIKMDDLGVPLFLETPVYHSFATVMSGFFVSQKYREFGVKGFCDGKNGGFRIEGCVDANLVR